MDSNFNRFQLVTDTFGYSKYITSLPLISQKCPRYFKVAASVNSILDRFQVVTDKFGCSQQFITILLNNRNYPRYFKVRNRLNILCCGSSFEQVQELFFRGDSSTIFKEKSSADSQNVIVYQVTDKCNSQWVYRSLCFGGVKSQQSVARFIVTQQSSNLPNNFQLDVCNVVLPYVREIIDIVSKKLEVISKPSVLILGCGGGLILSWLYWKFDALISIDVVELDQIVIKAAAQTFGLQANQFIQVHNMDGIDFVKQQYEKQERLYDVIIIDVFDNLNQIPKSFLESQFLQILKGIIGTDGIVVLNFVFKEQEANVGFNPLAGPKYNLKNQIERQELGYAVKSKVGRRVDAIKLALADLGQVSVCKVQETNNLLFVIEKCL